jgi:uncharacterized UBP type Zn finger protein
VSQVCEHLDSFRPGPKPSKEAGCQQCLDVGDTWVHLRACVSCGQIGCCDQSKNQHARRHAEATEFDHPTARTLEPGEDWVWCYRDEAGVLLT